MRKNNRTYSPSLNTLLVSVAVATIPGMGYAAYTTTDCNNFKNIYPTAFSNLGCSGWNGKCSWDAFRAELISVCNTKGQNIDCEESAESGLLAAILAENCHYYKTMTTAELCATNSNNDDLKACFATSGGGDDDNPGGTGGTNTPPSTTYICKNSAPFARDANLTLPTTSVSSLYSCYVDAGQSFKDSTGHTLQFVSKCYYPNYNQ